MKKFILVLAGMLLMTATVYAADYSPWAEESIEKAVEAGIVPDTLQSDYTNNITRREFCCLAVQTYMAKTGYTIPEGLQTPFTDIDDDYVTAAYTIGIVSGVGNDMFNPDSAITRQEAAVMLNNLAYMAGVDNSNVREDKYADEEYFADWAEDAIYKVSAIDSGGTPVMTGTGNNKFSPWMNYTREQAVVTMYRLYGCDAVPVLIPKSDDSFYFTFQRGTLMKFDPVTNKATELIFQPNLLNTSIIASGDKVYYSVGDTSTLNFKTSETLYRINSDGTGNVALTPDDVDAYLGHRYIYYVTSEDDKRVVRTNLEGSDPVYFDFSKECGEYGWCSVEADDKNGVYVKVNTGDWLYPEGYRNSEEMYFYNFSTGEIVKLPEDTNVGWLKTGALTDGKYSYSYYEYYVNPPRDFINNIIYTFNSDGTDPRELYQEVPISNREGTMVLYKYKLYMIYAVNPENGERYYTLCSFDREGNITPYNLDVLNRSDIVLMGILNDKVYFCYRDNGTEHFCSINLDGTDYVEYEM